MPALLWSFDYNALSVRMVNQDDILNSSLRRTNFTELNPFQRYVCTQRALPHSNSCSPWLTVKSTFWKPIFASAQCFWK